MWTSGGQNSYNRSDMGTKVDEYKAISFRFVRYLIDMKAINPVQPRMNKLELVEYFGSFKAKVPCSIKGPNIIEILNQKSLLVKRNKGEIPSDEIEFKKIVFVDINNDGVEKSQKMQVSRIRAIIFVDESKLFCRRIKKESAITGMECRMCRKIFTDQFEMDDHVSSDVHRFRELYRTARCKFATEIEGLSINEITRVLKKDESDESVLRISTNSSHGVFEVKKEVHLIDLEGIETETCVGRLITMEKTFQLKLTACFSDYCTYEYPMVFVIEDLANSRVHNLLSIVTYRVLKREIHDLYTGIPFQSTTKKYVAIKDAPVVFGVPLPSISKTTFRAPLPHYPIPEYVNKFLRTAFISDSLASHEKLKLRMIRKILLSNSTDSDEFLCKRAELTSFNYMDRFELLLYFEEYQQHRSLLLYNRSDVTLKASESRNLLDLEVLGLSENRPSILKGDSVFVLFPDKKKKFEGVVHKVQENAVSLAFGKEFHYINQKVEVEFKLNRHAFRMAHRALELISKENLTSIMFPTQSNGSVLSISNDKVVKRYFNQQIEKNECQKLAVNNILLKTAHPAPYIVYGPPGTGKTCTIVEAMTQLVFNAEKTLRICACAPSNAAANVLTCRLIKHVPESQVLRLFSMSYNPREVPVELHGCSNYTGENDEMLFPDMELIKSKRVVVLTPITAGRLYSVLSEGYFDYLFFDEAGQAQEPLFLIPLTGLLKRKGSKMVGDVVLAGDPKQLGPIIHSRLASHFGLDTSIIERLMETCSPYQKTNGVYNANYITQLIYNYRSHPSFLNVPNQLFYDEKLECRADQNITHWLCSWDVLPVKNVPLIFHGVKGKDDREFNSPSYFNLDEINRVGDYLMTLLGVKIKGREVKQDDIVVLTPYRKQVQKFRQYFRKKKWENISVSSIEEFQGQERSIVIISCVRSRKEFLPTDYQFGLGFLRNPKRFNVSITRARALMIIVGNPNVLQCDPHWKKLLDYCEKVGCYKGAKPDCEIQNTDIQDDNASVLSYLSGLVSSADMTPESEKPSFPKHD